MHTAEELIKFQDWEDISSFISGFSVPATLLHSISEHLQDLNKDTFSKAQLASKFWMVDTLKRYNLINNKDMVICGGWYGVLASYILSSGHPKFIRTLDRDPEATDIAKEFNKLNACYDNYEAVCGNMLEHDYSDNDIIINTSFEHIENSTDWFKQIQKTNDKNPIVVIQSNNYKQLDEHVNCSTSLTDLIDKCGLKRIFYSGKVVFPIYERYMIIGTL